MISIIIPVYNGGPVIGKCLDSVLASARNMDCEILVIDDGSTDNSMEVVSRYIRDNVNLLRNCKNMGFARTVNKGIDKAKGEIVVFLNMDTVVEPGWLEEIVKPFNSDTAVGITGSKMFYMDNGLIQHAGGSLDKISLSYHIGNKELDDGRHNKSMDVKYVCGASMACRKDMLKKLGGLDPGYSPLYYEEIDLAYRFRKAGYKIIYAPCSRLSHYEGYSVKKNGLDVFYFASRSRLRYVFKAYSIKDIIFGFISDEIKYFITLKNKDKKTILKSYIYNIIMLPEILFSRLRDRVLILKAAR